MKKYIQYNVATGEITQIFDCSENDSIEHLSGYGYEIIESNGDYSDGYVQNGELLHFPAKPSPHHEWDWTTKSWLPNLDAARETQRQAWNAWRDRELVAGFPHNGYVFHSDDTFIGELQLFLKGYERGHLTSTSAIRTRDNAVLQMPHAEIESLLLLIGLHRQVIYAQSWAGKDALASLATLEDIVAGGPPE